MSWWSSCWSDVVEVAVEMDDHDRNDDGPEMMGLDVGEHSLNGLFPRSYHHRPAATCFSPR